MKEKSLDWVDEFAHWASQLKVTDIPPQVAEKLSLQILNVIAASCGALQADAKDMLSLIAEASREGRCSIIGVGKGDPFSACFYNSATSMWHDFDDYLFMGHTCHSSFFASLAACQHSGADFNQLLTCMAIANELEGRLGAAVLIGPHNGQMWAHIHQAGAAVATVKALGGSEREFKDALLMALYMPPYTLEGGFMGSDAKKLTSAIPSESGIRIGLFAMRGAKGGDVLYGKKGFFHRFSFLPFTEFLSAFGTTWVTETLSFKPFPGCAYLQAPVECIVEILAECERSGGAPLPEDIRRIKIRANILTLGMENMSRRHRKKGELLPVNVNFSAVYSSALTIVNKRLVPRDLSPGALEDVKPKVFQLAEKVELKHDWSLTADMLSGLQNGVNFWALARGKGLVKTAIALRKVRKEHPLLSPWREALNLLRSGQLPKLRKALRTGEQGSFSLNRAPLHKLEFNFAAEVEIETKGGVTYHARKKRHSGACGGEREEIEKVVRKKFTDQLSPFVGEKEAHKLASSILKRDISISELGDFLSELPQEG